MKRFGLLACTVLAACSDPAVSPSEATRTHVGALAARAGIPRHALPTLETVAELPIAGGTITRTRQVIDGLPVYRHELRTLVRGGGDVLTSTGTVFDRRMPRSARWFADDEAGAIARAVRYTHPEMPTVHVDQARARQVWYPHADGLVAAWVVEAYTSEPASTNSELYRTVIAGDGRVLAHDSLVADAAFTYNVFAEPDGEKRPLDGPTEDATPHPTGVPDGSFPAYVAQTLVTVDGLNGPGDPWLPDGATETRGNNVDAYVDLAAPNGLGDGDFRATASGGVFGHVYDTAQGPLDSVEQQMAAITSLFYVINWLHDFWYDAGFTEVAGNAQASNYGRGGLEDDVLLAEAQDNALGGSRNNANMATPDDGLSPRMQVYLWNGRDAREIELSPSGRTPAMGGAVFGPRNFTVTAEVVLGQDGMGASPTDGCTPYTNAVADKLVLVDRGNCTFKTKTLHAQNAGARGVIIANNTTSTNPPTLGDDSALSDAIDIPAVSVTQAEGATIKTELDTGTVTATIHREVAPELEGALDATLIAHEFGHYLHHRLSFCNNRMCRALSEGWGDFVALLLLARPGDDLTGAFPFSVYATQGINIDAGYYGIRRAPYSTNFDINALTFRHMADREELPAHHPMQPSSSNSEVHNAGEVWASALWEVYVALQQAGGGTFEEIRAKMARYVVSGLQMAPLDASPLETRDALLAVALAASPADHQVMIEAFARRGFGSCAVAPPPQSVDFVGIVESHLVAGNPQLAALSLADGCDEDGVLDTGETARLSIRVVNQGHAPLTDLSFTITSQVPGVTVLSPPSTLARLEPFATTDLEIDVTLEAGRTDAIAGDLALEVNTAGGCADTVAIPVAFRLNVDDVPAVETIDTFDTLKSNWSPWTAAWSHVRASPLDGYWHGDALPIRSDTRLTSPPLVASETEPVTMTFTHRFSFEHSSGIAWDGGVIEYSVDSGVTWEDIAELAPAGYNGAISDESDNVLAGRRGYIASSPAWPDVQTVTIDLGTQLAGQTFHVRFRIATDSGTGGHGWDVDDVGFTGLANKPFPAQLPDDGLCEPPSPFDDPIISGGGGCCDGGRASSGLLAFAVLALVRRRRPRRAGPSAR